MNGPDRPHFIKRNERTRLPRRHVVFDTEAHQAGEEGVKVQTFRCASASFDHESKKGRGWSPTEYEDFDSPRALWEWVSARTRPRARTIAVAHNLAYDLRISQALTVLPELGWRLDMIRLDTGSAWCQFKRDGATLTMVDSVSWFGRSVEHLAQLEGLTKPTLPRWNAPLSVWLARCRADVEVVRRAWMRALHWVEDADLGNWKPTGAGQGWAVFRHRHLTHPIMHHGMRGLAAVEREAGWAGRCEAWRWGRLPRGPWSEYDLTCCYTRIAEDEPVPVRFTGHLGPASTQKALEGPESDRILCRVIVSTATPVVPCRGSQGVLWPVGTFPTVLWDVEVRAAVAAGASIRYVEGWRYAAAPALRQWAGWVLDLLDQAPADLHPTLRLVVKGWSRSTVGRFGSRWSSWEPFGEGFEGGVSLSDAYDATRDRRFRILSLGDRSLWETERVDAPDSAVFVMSWIMAAARVRLWRIMCTAGLEHVAYCDTDSVLVDPEGAARLEAARLPGLRVKGEWSRVEVLGPRQVIFGGRLRASGVPSSAVRSSRKRWEAEVWRSLPQSIALGELDRVVIRDRSFSLSGVDRRRAHLAGGLTAPLSLG